MNDDDCFGPIGQFALDRTGGDVLRNAIYVSNDRLGTAGDDTTRGRNESATCGDDLITWTDSQSVERQFQRHCAVCQRHRMTAADLLGKLFFELLSFLTSP